MLLSVKKTIKKRIAAVEEFITKIWGDEVIVVHQRQGHLYKFPVLIGGMVHLRGAKIEANPKARRDAEGYLHEAHYAACAAVNRSRLDGP